MCLTENVDQIRGLLVIGPAQIIYTMLIELSKHARLKKHIYF